MHLMPEVDFKYLERCEAIIRIEICSLCMDEFKTR